MMGTLIWALLWTIGLIFAWPILVFGLSWWTAVLEVAWLGFLYWWAAGKVGGWDNKLDTPRGNAALPGLGAYRFDLPTLLKLVPKVLLGLLIVVALAVFIWRGLTTSDGSADTAPQPAPAASTSVTQPAPRAPDPLPPSVVTEAALSADVPLCDEGESVCFRWYGGSDDWAKPESCLNAGCETPWWRDS
jgi:hypothetical protein